jgi:hypothetical protein
MPYRRLPNTDSARYKALQKAYQKGKELPPFKLSFSQSTYQKIISFLPLFEKTIIHQKGAMQIQTERNLDYLPHVKKVKMYISHFIQVVNMAIQRGELPESILEDYKLTEYGFKVPPMNTEDEICVIGRNLIEGETLRIRKGFPPVTNPTIALVKVWYEKFLDAYQDQKNLQMATSRAQKDLASLRPQADEIILYIWNEVENSFKDLPDNLKRDKASEYGLVYVYRKTELSSQIIITQQNLGIG